MENNVLEEQFKGINKIVSQVALALKPLQDTTFESFRVNWLRDISTILNNTIVSLNKFPDFN